MRYVVIVQKQRTVLHNHPLLPPVQYTAMFMFKVISVKI